MTYAELFTIADVADLFGIRRLENRRDEFRVVCPFCGDTRGKCSFCVCKDGEVKNVYHCFHCGASGNMLTLYAELKGLYGIDQYKEAYRQIRSELKKGVSSIRQREYRKEKKALDPPQDLYYLDKVYRRMLTMLDLKEKHRADLLRRGLSESAVEQMKQAGYRSTQSSDSERIARKLLLEGYHLKGVPGFYVNRNGDWETAFYPANSGYLCPVYSAEGMLCGFQIRLDHPKDKRKYVWFTSSGLKGGTSSKSPASLSGTFSGSTIRVTEGILKAEIAYQMTGQAYIGVPGVSNYKGLQGILEMLKKKGLRTVLECYDMDKMLSLTCRQDYNETCRSCEKREGFVYGMECPKKRQKRDMIRGGCLKLYEICEELGLQYRRITWDTDQNGIWRENYKGIDDWMIRYTGNRAAA